MVKKILQNVALICATACTAVIGNIGIAAAQVDTGTPSDPQTQQSDSMNVETQLPDFNLGAETATDMNEWTKSLNLGDVCPANVTIYIPPSGLSTPVSNPLVPHPGGIHQQVTMTQHPKNVVLTLPYNALWTTGIFTYNESRDSGIRAANTALSAIHSQCPGARIHLYGYSEGADVGAHIVESISQDRGPIPKNNFGSAAFQGNPVRSNVGTHRAGSAGDGRGLFSPANYGDQAGKVMEICNERDVVCNTSSVAPNFYYLYEDMISNSAPLRGKISLREAVNRANPEIVARSGIEIPSAIDGWIRHATEYYTTAPYARDAGENFIRAHYA